MEPTFRKYSYKSLLDRIIYDGKRNFALTRNPIYLGEVLNTVIML